MMQETGIGMRCSGLAMVKNELRDKITKASRNGGFF
jgi:hypothetical protein